MKMLKRTMIKRIEKILVNDNVDLIHYQPEKNYLMCYKEEPCSPLLDRRMIELEKLPELRKLLKKKYKIGYFLTREEFIGCLREISFLEVVIVYKS